MTLLQQHIVSCCMATVSVLTLLLTCCSLGSASTPTPTSLPETRLPSQLRAALNTAPCTVSGERIIPHGQQIEREDPCEFCICIDSNVFCWWGQQHCTSNTTFENFTDSSVSSKSDMTESTESINTTDSSPATTVPTSCIVMGRQYSLGAVLPRDTGTCLECVCGKGGRVTCSPKDCIRPNDDFHNSDPSNSLDMFDVDVF